MRFKAPIHLSYLAALALSPACRDHSKDEEATPPPAPSQSENLKIYSQNVSAAQPLLLVYGDSIATGVLSDTTLGQDASQDILLQLSGYIKSGSYTAEGFQAGVSHPELAAATTGEAYGVRQSIASSRGLTSSEVGVISLARFGARASDIPEMLSDWQEHKASGAVGVRDPDYVLIALGSNDFCSDASPELIRENFQTQIEAVHRSAPDATLIVVPAPPVPQIGSIDFTYNSPLAELAGEEISCRRFREQYCKNIYAPDASERWTAINEGISAAVSSQKDQGTRVLFAEDVKNWTIVKEELSFDCFHPSKRGQETLGRLIQPVFNAAP